MCGSAQEMEKVAADEMPKNKVKPDTALKAYWRRNAEFADLFNAVLFGGEPVIDAGKLEERDTDLVFHNQNNIDLFMLFKLIYDWKKTNAERRAAAEQYEKDHPVDELVMMAIASTGNIDLDLYKKEDVTVCALFDEIEKRGEEKKAKETAKKLYEMGLNIDQIVQAVSYPVEVIEKWLGLVTV